jgi:hypothetical protein
VEVDLTRREATLPFVVFNRTDAREHPHTLARGGGTSSASAAAPIETPMARPLVHGIVYGPLALTVAYGVSWIGGAWQEYELRRNTMRFRSQLMSAPGDGERLDPDDVVATVRRAAASAGVPVSDDDVEVIARRVEVGDTAGRVPLSGGLRCEVKFLPDEYERMSRADQLRFDDHPPRCDRDRWIVGFRAELRTGRWLTNSRFTVERFTWVDDFSPNAGGAVAILE